MQTKKELHRYKVEVTPNTNRSERRKILNKIVDHLDGRIPAYDGMEFIYTAGELPFTSLQHTVIHRTRKFLVIITHSKRVCDVEEFLDGQLCNEKEIENFNLVLKQYPMARYFQVGSSFFSTSFHFRGADVGDLGWQPGYFQSVRPTQRGLALNLDVCSALFQKPMSIVDFVAWHLRINDKTRPLIETHKNDLNKALRGVSVEVTHRGDPPPTYKITGITTENLSELQFKENGVEKTVMQYFKEHYDIELRYLHWPCLKAGRVDKPNFLPMEVCKIAEVQIFSKKLDTRNRYPALLISPKERKESILEKVQLHRMDEDKCADDVGLSCQNNLMEVQARILPPPVLRYRGEVYTPRGGTWHMDDKQMFRGGEINRWAFVNFSTIPIENVRTFCTNLIEVCRKHGMKVAVHPELCFSAPAAEVAIHLRDAHRKAGPLQLIIVILPEFKGSYGLVKRVCETELGLVSQCCLPKKVRAPTPKFMTNVALKINAKVGGCNNFLADAAGESIYGEKCTIIFGADVTHPAEGCQSSPSIAAVVASMDWPQLTKYKCCLSTQNCNQEMIDGLYIPPPAGCLKTKASGTIRDMLQQFIEANHREPERIIVYRDGVSESQFSEVLRNEMLAIEDACASIRGGFSPPVTFIVAQKRHSTRLFPGGEEGAVKQGRNDNILPGTIVDTEICDPKYFDFFLCSYDGTLGKSKPIRYWVLWDGNNFTSDEIQILTYHLCYTSVRCTKAVSLVPPAHYAHLAAERARCYLVKESDGEQFLKINDSLKDSMFYC